MKTRLNKCLLFVGRKGTGKTTIALKLGRASGKKICVVDTDDHPAYADFKLVRVEDLHKWKTGNIRVITSDPEQALLTLNKFCSDAFIICEDCAKYINGNLRTGVKAFIIDMRKRNFDTAFMFHFFADVPPYVAKQYDYMIIFKTGDNLDEKQRKFANWNKIEAISRRVNRHSSYNYCEKINIDE